MTVQDPHPPGQAGADPVPSARLRAAVPLGALALALLLAIVPLHDRLADALNDALLGWFSTPAKLNDVLVIDIDDISLHEVKPWLGPWPFRRETHALMIDFLREAGASVIGIAIVFTDAREGDEELKRALAGPGAPVVLAAAGLRQPVDAEHDAQRAFDALAGLHTSVALASAPASAPTSRWPALALPSAGLLAALPRAPRLGVITTPLSDDGRLRRLPLLHEVNGRLLTAFPLTMQLATMAQPRLDYDAARRVFNAGSTPWPVDSQGMAGLAFPRAPDALQHLRYSELAAAMLGRRDANALRQLIKGRAVFVGSSAFFGDGVMTAAGQLSGTALLASSYAALRDGSLLRPPLPVLDSALWLIALVPAVMTWRRPRPAFRRDVLAALLALVAVAGSSVALLLLWRQQTQLVLPLAMIGAGLLMALLTQQRLTQLANRHLAQERAVADAANRAKSEFLANVSHEIRTPLNALLGVAELLAETPLDEMQRRHVEVFRRSGETLFAMVNDLLDLAKIEAGKIELRVVAFSPHQLVQEQLRLLRKRAHDQGLKLTAQLAPEVPAFVFGDPQRLGQALLNLLSNAVKFTRRGDVRLTVQPEPGAAHQLCFRVEDTGIGIAASKLGAIFQPFTQADGSVERTYGGTGLGLSITRSLAELMGGGVTVASTPGVGTCFELRVRLPRAPQPPMLEAQDAHRHGAGPGQSGPLNILLVEDNPTNVYLVESMLRGDGHHIEVAAHGLLAIERVRRSRYDLVLMDVQMPGMDGHTATREIRRLEAELGREPVPLIVLSAHAFDSDAQRSLEAGGNAYLSKPLSRQALLEAIRRHRPPRGAGAATAEAAVASQSDPAGVAAAASGDWLAHLAASGVIDPALALQRFDGDTRLYWRVLEHANVFFSSWSQTYLQAHEKGDLAHARRLTHDLKGIAGSIGAVALADAARAYDERERNSPNRSHDAEMRAAVEVALRSVVLAVTGNQRRFAPPPGVAQRT